MPTTGSAPSFYAVTVDGVQYVAVGANGAVYTSPINIAAATTLTWTNNSIPATSSTLYGVIGTEAFYVAAGASGAVFTSK